MTILAPRLLVAVVAAAALSVAPKAYADADPVAVASPDMPTESSEGRHAIDRTWLYADDARIPAPMTVVATTSTSYTNVGSSPFRVDGVSLPTKYSAFDSNTAQPGVMFAVGGELGLFPHVSVMALGELGVAGVNGTNGGGVVGLRVSVLPARFTHLHLVLSGGYLRESWEGPIYDDDSNRWTPGNPNGDNGMWYQAAISGDIGRLRLVGNFHAEHVFATGRDPLDLMVDLGASYRVAGPFRAGVEWVGQDLEESFTPAAEGGARMFFGPTASAQLLENRLSIVAGPAIGISQVAGGIGGEAPNFIARAAASYGF